MKPKIINVEVIQSKTIKAHIKSASHRVNAASAAFRTQGKFYYDEDEFYVRLTITKHSRPLYCSQVYYPAFRPIELREEYLVKELEKALDYLIKAL